MKAIDPICGMEVDTATAQWKADYKGQTYYFCAPGCKRTFEKDPEKALTAGPSHGMMMGSGSEHKD
jgi:YHS domain-containing protein